MEVKLVSVYSGPPLHCWLTLSPQGPGLCPVGLQKGLIACFPPSKVRQALLSCGGQGGGTRDWVGSHDARCHSGSRIPLPSELISPNHRFLHNTPLLKSLQWLPMAPCSQHKSPVGVQGQPKMLSLTVAQHCPPCPSVSSLPIGSAACGLQVLESPGSHE